LCWLAGRGSRAAAESASWRHWLLQAAGVADPDALLARWPAGPSVATLTGATRDSGPATWARAQAVHLATGIDHLRMSPLQNAAMNVEEGAAIAATFNAHFAARGYELFGRSADTWVLHCAATIECRTHDPAGLVGQNVHDFMPDGPHGALVRSLMNETQMLLHEHPVNEQRRQRRESPVNAVWPWGFGPVPDAAHEAGAERGDACLTQWPLSTDDAWLHGLWRLLGGHTEWLADPQQALDPAGDHLVAVSLPRRTDSDDALRDAESQLFAPLRSEFEAGRVGRLVIHAGELVITVDSRARYRIWRGALDAAQLFA
jgi:hypothetical protein